MTSRDEYLLLPASRAYIAFTILLAVVLNIMPWGRDYGIPDFLALVLVFWNVHQPRKVGIGIGFLLGLLMDVHSSSALGERALLYSLLCYGAWLMHRRVPWFSIGAPVATLASTTTNCAMTKSGSTWSIWPPMLNHGTRRCMNQAP